MAIFSRDENKLDKDFLAELNRGRENLQRTAPKRDEGWAFYRNEQFAYINARGALSFLPDGIIGVKKSGKESHRARQQRNYIFDVVLREASQASQRVPSYQVVPSTNDPADASAASLAEKVALFGYHKWNLRQATIDAVTHAIVGGEAFAWPFWDSSIGPFVGEGEEAIGTGDVRVRIYGGNECFWLPGVRFYDSPWHVVEQAVSPAQVKAMPGYLGGELTLDADSRSSAAKRSDKAKLVMVTHYLERPCPKYPKGRWITIANQRRILADRDYPGSGEAPVLRPLFYAPDPDSDRSLGLVPNLLDAQRTKNDAENKAIEAKNHVLFPKIFVTPGLLKKQRWTDEIGKLYEVPNPNENVKLVELGGIPSELFTMADRATDDLLRIAGQQDIPPGVESGKAIQALLEKNQARSAMFVANLAEWHANVMSDCLVQVQENYSEPRLIALKGDFGWDSEDDFKGARLNDQTDVRVFVDSIEPQTRQAREQKIMNFVQMGAVDPVSAMTALETGSTEGLIRGVVQDQGRVNRIIQRIKSNTIWQMVDLPTGRLQKVPQIDPMTGQPAIDPMTGQPVMVDGSEPEMGPGWMPRYSDDLRVFRSTFEDWMKTEEFERIANDPIGPEGADQQPIGQIAATIYAGVLQLEAQKAGEAAAAQNAQAEQLGMNNAARPQGAKPNPSLPSLNGDGESQPTPA